VEALEQRDYGSMENPSLLRFLVDMRGEDTTTVQLRDDLITMLIAGHETTASALTWALFELVQQPELLATVRKEIDEKLGDRRPTAEDIEALELVRLCIAESLRMYPEPPLLIRRAIEEDEIPRSAPEYQGETVKMLRGSDIFIAVYNLHRSPKYWENPDLFDPTRWHRPFKNPELAPEWKGYNPDLWRGQLLPTENSCDFAFLPFGAGPRKCIGDNFAMMEATVAFAMLLRRYDFAFSPTGPTPRPEDVGTNTGATIHTRNGMWMDVTKRPLP
jgi:cytochrome P450